VLNLYGLPVPQKVSNLAILTDEYKKLNFKVKYTLAASMKGLDVMSYIQNDVKKQYDDLTDKFPLLPKIIGENQHKLLSCHHKLRLLSDKISQAGVLGEPLLLDVVEFEMCKLRYENQIKKMKY